MKLIIKAKEIKGKCPVYNRGDKIVIDEGYILSMRETEKVCMHSLASVMPYYVALSRGIKPRDLGLSKKNGTTAYLQCLDPCHYTGGGTVIFEIEIKED